MTSTQLHAAVEAALTVRWPRADLGPLKVLEGGRSGITLHAELRGADADAVVVKAASEGRPATGRHDVLRQARVIRSLASVDGVIVPDVLASGSSPVAFFAMTRSPGEAVEPVLDAARVHLEPGLVRDRAMESARMLAALHQVADIPPPPARDAEPVADLAAELRRWRATADAADPAVLVDGTQLALLLEKTLPVDDVPPVLVHGDYRLGNIVFDGPQATGLIDWEIWGRTHPGVDLGWFLVFCDADLFPGIGTPVSGLPTAGVLLDCYRDCGGNDIADLAWFEAFCRFKMAAIMAHNLRRHREGRHVDPFQEKLPPTIERLVATGIDRLGGLS